MPIGYFISGGGVAEGDEGEQRELSGVESLPACHMSHAIAYALLETSSPRASHRTGRHQRDVGGRFFFGCEADNAMSSLPLAKMAEPVEIAACAEFLASNDAGFVTGATLVADGGGEIVDVGAIAG